MPKITSIKEMKAHYEAEIPYMAANWFLGKKKAIENDAFCKGLEGIEEIEKCNPVINKKWKDRLEKLTAEDFKKALEEKKAADRLVENWLTKMSAPKA